MLVTLGDRTVTLRRNTAYVLDAVAAAASLTVTRQPVREGLLRVVVAGGTTGSGTVTITGTVAGVVGVSEVLTFAGRGTKETVKRFSALSPFATTGLADEILVPTLSVQNVGPDGTPQAQAYDVAAGIPLRPQKGSGRWQPGVPGAERDQESRWRLPNWEVWAPRVGDHLVDEEAGDVFLVQSADKETVGFDFFWLVRTTRL